MNILELYALANAHPQVTLMTCYTCISDKQLFFRNESCMLVKCTTLAFYVLTFIWRDPCILIECLFPIYQLDIQCIGIFFLDLSSVMFTPWYAMYIILILSLFRNFWWTRWWPRWRSWWAWRWTTWW